MVGGDFFGSWRVKTDYSKLAKRLEDMSDRKTRYNYSTGDYWNALGDAAEAIEELIKENESLRAKLLDNA